MKEDVKEVKENVKANKQEVIVMSIHACSEPNAKMFSYTVPSHKITVHEVQLYHISHCIPITLYTFSLTRL